MVIPFFSSVTDRSDNTVLYSVVTSGQQAINEILQLGYGRQQVQEIRLVDQDHLAIFQGINVTVRRTFVIITFTITDPPGFNGKTQHMFCSVVSHGVHTQAAFNNKTVVMANISL